MEILAPCGSPAHLKAAVYAGADAVYLGGKGFSARRNAANFSNDEIAEAAAFCRGFGVKLYVTVNILTRDAEWNDVKAYIAELAKAAPDALIVQDTGVARLCRDMFPDLPIHASTQMSVHSLEGVKFCEELGFSRVVIARECDKDTLAEIVKGSTIGVEMFVHGALCVSVSGQCRLSAVIGGRSGNRGLCAQPCRLSFTDGVSQHALSLKDLCLIREIPVLRDMGIEALKIEGRMKRPEYVAAAVHACRVALEGGQPDIDTLKAVFSRSGFTQGYYTGQRNNMGGIRTKDDVLDTSAALPGLTQLYRAPSRRVEVDIDFKLEDGGSLLILSDGQNTVRIAGVVPEKAVKRAVTVEEAEKMLSRMGDTPFIARNVNTTLTPGLTMPSAAINSLRREGCAKLIELRQKPPVYKKHPEPLYQHAEITPRYKPALRVQCRLYNQALAALPSVEYVMLPIGQAGLMIGTDYNKLIIEPERFVIDEMQLERRLLELKERGISRMLCQNPAHAVIGRRLGYTLHGGMELNVFNSESIRFWKDFGLADVTASTELKLSECQALKSVIPVGIAAYGCVSLMLLRRCPFECVCRTSGECPGYLTDRTGRRFRVLCYGEWQELLNADTLWMADKDIKGVDFLSLFLSDETPDETVRVLEAYRDGGAPPDSFTRGLLYRGVE